MDTASLLFSLKTVYKRNRFQKFNKLYGCRSDFKCVTIKEVHKDGGKYERFLYGTACKKKK